MIHRAALTALLLSTFPAFADPIPQGPKNVPGFTPAFDTQTRAPAIDSAVALEVRTVAEGLSHPWGIALLPDGGYLVTERAGRLRHVSTDGTVSKPIAGVSKVLTGGQAGLLDVAIAEDFAQSRVIYWTYSKPMPGGRSSTAAARGVLSPDMSALSEVRDIFVQDPPSPTKAHYGSRITPQGGLLWITTGEHFSEADRQNAQRLDATYGKVIRVRPDGGIPDDNPFAAQPDAKGEIWSLGHRNLQGDAIDAQGRYWTVEHGPKGGDELNRPEAGRNYGWPVISYGENYNGSPVGSGASAAPDMEQPVYYWDPVIAPGDMVFYEGAAFPDWTGSLLIGSLNPGGINRLVIDGDRVTGEEQLLPDLGRVRDIEVDADGTLLALIDSDDGALLRIVPSGAATD